MSRGFLLMVGWLLAASMGCRRASLPSADTVLAQTEAPSRMEWKAPFRDVALEAGITVRLGHGGKSPLNILETAGGGGGFLDYDGDLWPDVLIVGQDRLALYRNRGDGTFEEVTTKAGLSAQAFWMGCTNGDYDNDGDEDLLLTGYRRLVLYRNNGDGTYTDVTRQAGLEGLRRWWMSGAFADIDRDGDLDLYIAAYVRFDETTPQLCLFGDLLTACGPEAYEAEKGVLLRNNGDGTFSDITEQAGVANTAGKSWGVAFCDFDDDGWPDFYVSNDEMPCDLFHNRGDGTFENIGLSSGTAYDLNGNVQGGMGIDWGDYDGDGRLDLIVTNFFGQITSLYRNEGNGLFTAVSEMVGLGPPTLPLVAFGARFFDPDNDGDLDLILASGHIRDNVERLDPSASYFQPITLLGNFLGKFFVSIGRQAGEPFARRVVGRALSVADYDRDGDQDVLIVDLEGTPLLLRNLFQEEAKKEERGEGGGIPRGGENRRGNWLAVRVQGTRSPKDGTGARLTLWVEGKRRVAELGGGGSVLACHWREVFWGLGAAERVERLEVRWPSGRKEEWGPLAANQGIRLVEGKREFLPLWGEGRLERGENLYEPAD